VQPDPPRKRGRPREVDHLQLSLVALRLFERRGYERVTMDEIARTASVSRRTLFRAFPSKADLVWDGLDQVLAAAKVEARRRGRGGPPLPRLVEEVFSATLHQLDDPATAGLARRRLRVIARAPGLLDHQTLRELQEVVVRMVARRAAPGDPPPALVARALVAVGFASVLWWAEQGGRLTASEALHGAFVALGSSRGVRAVASSRA
jgi:AcrR family transcriptional regulator